MSVKLETVREASFNGVLPHEDQGLQLDEGVSFEHEELVKKGCLALDRGDYSDAIVLLSCAIDHFDEDPVVLQKLKEAHRRRGEIFFGQGHYLQAIEDFALSGDWVQLQKAQSLLEKLVEGGCLALDRGDYSEAIAFLGRTIDHSDENSIVLQKLKEAHRRRGETFFDQGRYLLAIPDFALSGERDQLQMAKSLLVEKLKKQIPSSTQSSDLKIEQYRYISNELELLVGALGCQNRSRTVDGLRDWIKSRLLVEQGNRQFRSIKEKLDRAVSVNQKGDVFSNREDAEKCLQELRAIQNQLNQAAQLDHHCHLIEWETVNQYLERVQGEVVNFSIAEWEETLENTGHRLANSSPYDEKKFDAVQKDCRSWLDLFEKLALHADEERCIEKQRIIELLENTRQAKIRIRDIDRILSVIVMQRALEANFGEKKFLSERDADRFLKEYERVFKEPALRTQLLRLSFDDYESFMKHFIRYLQSRVTLNWRSNCVFSKDNPLTVDLVRSWLRRIDRKKIIDDLFDESLHSRAN